VRKVFKRALGKAKLPAFRLYDLRHTFASLRLAASAPIIGADPDQIWNQTGSKSQIGHPGDPEVADSIGGPSRTRTLDPLIKSANQRVQPDDTDALSAQQLELWPDSQ
jgi:hypothetical protein